MASVLPSKLSDLVAFVDDHLPVWNAAAASIGLDPEQLAGLTSQLGVTTTAITARNTAANAAKAATLTQTTQGSTLRTLAADAIRTIKTYAEAQADPSAVYAAAQIPEPATPKPAPPPAQPTDLSVSIVPTTGALTLKWKASNNGLSGTTYMIRRKAEGESAWTFVGVTGTKTFTDSTFVAGPDMVEYTVQGTRSGVNGPISLVLQVRFGAAPGGGFMVMSATEAEAPKLAA